MHSHVTLLVTNGTSVTSGDYRRPTPTKMYSLIPPSIDYYSYSFIQPVGSSTYLQVVSLVNVTTTSWFVFFPPIVQFNIHVFVGIQLPEALRCSSQISALSLAGRCFDHRQLSLCHLETDTHTTRTKDARNTWAPNEGGLEAVFHSTGFRVVMIYR